MCGIWAILRSGVAHLSPAEIAEAVRNIEARGPEYTAIEDVSGTQVTLGFTRLAINGLTAAGHQPFTHEGITVICNGEIYNYQALAQRHSITLSEGTSDCAVLPHLARHLTAVELCRTLDGVFAFVMVDAVSQTVTVARDPYGVRPLFQLTTPEGAHFWASELKALPTRVAGARIRPFPPGTVERYDARTGELLEVQKYHEIPHVKQAFASRSDAAQHLQEALVAAVRKRLLSDRPIGALLSGGVDSSLVAAIAARELATHGKRIHTFSIGMPGSTDLVFAAKVAAHINSIHHEIVVAPEDFLAAIPEVVYAAETYDITSVRASVGNYLVGKYIKTHTDIKVVFNGDGSDEVGGGYLYFYAAPSDEAFESESERLLREIHLFDVLRSDRSMAAHGLEARTPFLDKAVVAAWRAIPTAWRRPMRGDSTAMEKQILREAFDASGLLPSEVLWRKKEAFSDGVSATTDSWYVRCAAHARTLGTVDLAAAATWHNPPSTEEAYWYRALFEAAYGPAAATVIPHMWMPRWIAGARDPSARTLTSLYA